MIFLTTSVEEEKEKKRKKKKKTNSERVREFPRQVRTVVGSKVICRRLYCRIVYTRVQLALEWDKIIFRRSNRNAT